jgi:hypothetical protein
MVRGFYPSQPELCYDFESSARGESPPRATASRFRYVKRTQNGVAQSNEKTAVPRPTSPTGWLAVMRQVNILGTIAQESTR